ncbi:MAG: exodeoxyribonuclease V subunit gamma [Rhodococcus sp. (in: high G+C Gram-positive bacteria)]
MLRVHRASRTSVLASALAGVMSTPLADPFAPEIVSVPARGVERWLTQRLSQSLGATRGDGISANVEFPSPTQLVDDALAAAAGIDAADDPWSSGKLLWTTLAVVDDSMDEPWGAVVAKHLDHGRGDQRAGRRWSTAAHLTELFRRYGADRPQMLVDWWNDVDSDGMGGDVPSDLRWQAHLWRAVHERVGCPSPAERLVHSCDAIRASPDLLGLPNRLSIFGATRLTADQLQVLAAIAEHRDVHFWLPHASAEMWRTRIDLGTVVRRSRDPSVVAISHPLLASLGRDIRELQSRLLALDVETVDRAEPEVFDSPTLLGRVQADLAAAREPSQSAQPDGTISVHACHGAPRQVEVLREALLHLFDDDPTLEPRDVLVMCPDVETYAPLIRATFGQGTLDHPGHSLRVRLADRGLRQTNSLLAVMATVLELAVGRVTASQVLDLVATEPVRLRFGFTDDDLERLREWTLTSGARWGINSRQRESYGLGDFRQNTFNTALDRLLLGVTADESAHAWLDLALPVDDVDSNDIDLTGRVAEFVDRLAAVVRDLQGPATAEDWRRVLVRALDLLAEVSQTDAWQRAQAHREISAALQHGGGTVLRLADVRAMLARALHGRPSRANFRTGDLTVCTMVPMRSVPHRVVVLLGLDDDVFPRTGGVDGDDVLAREPAPGERDVRSEDRQLLLDAVMSAGEKLLLFYTGADPVSGVTKPPAIPLSELLDVVRVTAGADIVVAHPLQPFDVRNFRSDEPFSYDTAALDGARASQRDPTPSPVLLPTALPPRRGTDISLNDLVAFFEHPVAAFLKQRLGVRIPEIDDDGADSLDITLDGLRKWDVGDRMLAELLNGTELGDFKAAEWRRGTLPPFHLGTRQLEDIVDGVDTIYDASREVHSGTPEVLDISVDTGDGHRLTGTVTGIHGNTVARTSYSRLAPKHRMAQWIRLLAVASQDAGRPWQAVTTGRGVGHSPLRSTITAPEDALTRLRDLIKLRNLGLDAPLPVMPSVSATYAERRCAGSKAADAWHDAEEKWSGRFGDSVDRSVVYLLGESAPLSALTEGLWNTPRKGLPDSGNETQFEVLACALWRPLLDSEDVRRP